MLIPDIAGSDAACVHETVIVSPAVAVSGTCTFEMVIGSSAALPKSLCRLAALTRAVTW